MVYEFKFPDVGEGVHEGKVLQLKKKPGEEVEEGDILAVVETDKVVAEIPSPRSGILKSYRVSEGQIIKVGEILAEIEIEGEFEEEVEVKPEKVPVEDTAGVVGELEAPGETVLPSSGEGLFDRSPETIPLTPGQTRVLATPVARKLAADFGIDISTIKGSGPAGRVMKSDVEKMIQLRQTEPEAKLPGKDITSSVSIPADKSSKVAEVTDTLKTVPLTTLRKTIARNMELSQQIPVALIQDFGVIDELVNFRETINQGREDRISFQPLFIKALVGAIKRYPLLNSTYNAEKEEYTLYPYVNVGLAVDTDQGLMVPVIKHAERKSVVEINREMRELVERARNRTIQLEELRGGTISITNYGPFGGVYGRPLILPPQVAIVGFGRIHQTAVIKDGEVQPAWVLPVSVPFDHRVIDGATASSFVSYLLKLLSNPEELLLSI